MKYLSLLFATLVLIFCSCNRNRTVTNAGQTPPMKVQDSLVDAQDRLMPDGLGSKDADSIKVSATKITPEMAYEGVNNYCHSMYDWSVAEENPSMMYVKMGEETESAYKVIFRSYTGAFVYFYVEKAGGITRMVEYEPALDAESEAGTINLLDYLEKKE